ncbi:hypothetical protein LTR48_008865 [Friedmanniomyces endolithicus]|nr:hypothetical protein LTR48_008865 [Friedmanniomyces endolithicus]
MQARVTWGQPGLKCGRRKVKPARFTALCSSRKPRERNGRLHRLYPPNDLQQSHDGHTSQPVQPDQSVHDGRDAEDFTRDLKGDHLVKRRLYGFSRRLASA